MEQIRNPRGVANTRQTVYEDFPPSSDWTHDANCHVLLIDLPGFKREDLKVQVDNFRKVTVSGERQVSENKYSRFKQVYEVPEDSDIDSISGRFDGGVLFIVIPKTKTEIITQEPRNEIQAANEIEEEKKDEKPKHEKKDEKQYEEPKKNDDVNQVDSHNLQDKEEEEESKSHVETEGVVGDKRKKIDEVGTEGMVVDKRKKMEEAGRKLAERVKNKEELDIMVKTAMEKIRKNKTMIVTAMLAFSIGLYISRKIHSGGE